MKKKKENELQGMEYTTNSKDHYQETEIKQLIIANSKGNKNKKTLAEAKMLLMEYYDLSNLEKKAYKYGKELKEWFEVQVKNASTQDTKAYFLRKRDEFRRIYAKYDFETFIEYIEFLMPPEKQFYNIRKNNKAFKEIVKVLNESIMENKYNLVAISMPPRTGKALLNSELVVTPDGYKPIKDIKLGDLVASPNGNFVEVIGVFPQGARDIYRVWFNDNTYIDCDREHLWEVQNKRDRLNGTYRVMKTEDLANRKLQHNSNVSIYTVDITLPVAFSKKELKIEPYRFGRFISNLRDLDIKKELEEYGIKSNRNELFIPKDYLLSDIEDRYNLLKGIIGKRRPLDFNGNTVGLRTCNKRLAEDIRFLVESLGGTVRERQETIVDSNNRRNKYNYYTLTCNFPVERRFRYIKKVENLNMKKGATCIYVNDARHLFLTNHFIPTHNTQIGIRFLAWVCGRNPSSSNLGISCTSAVTNAFYNGIMEIIRDDERYRYNAVFPNALLVDQDAKDNKLWLGRKQMYQTIAFKSISSGVQGGYEASKVLYCDDLVEGYETAINMDRLDKLWETYLSNIANRKKTGCVEIHIGTRWSIHDPIGRLEKSNKGDKRCKFIRYPALNEKDASNFAYKDGFSTDAYQKIRKTYLEQDLEVIWKATYQNEPIERDGTVFEKDKLNYYYDLPQGAPDSKIAVIDSKNQGKDYVACAILYNYGSYWYLEDVVFSNKLPSETTIMIADKIIEHKVPVVYVESNNGGEYFAEKINTLVKEKNYFTSVATFFTSSNKITRIITQAPFIKEYILFKKTKFGFGTGYGSQYQGFMDNVFEFNQKGTAKHDDAPDVLSLASQQIQYMIIPTIEVGDRRKVGL